MLALNADQWVTVVIAIVGGVTTLGAALSAAALQNRHAKKMRTAEREERARAQFDTEAAQWRKDSSPAIGAATEFLTDILPFGMVSIDREQVDDWIKSKYERWENEIRVPLAQLGAHPSAEVARFADDTVGSINLTLALLKAGASGIALGGDYGGPDLDAALQHDKAQRSLDLLRRALRGEPIEDEATEPTEG